MKRFQECNKIVQVWRYRWYLLIPFKWLWFSYVRPFKVGVDETVDGKCVHTDKYEVMCGNDLWRLLIGIAQGKMKWYYTWEEVKLKIKKRP